MSLTITAIALMVKQSEQYFPDQIDWPVENFKPVAF